MWHEILKKEKKEEKDKENPPKQENKTKTNKYLNNVTKLVLAVASTALCQ